MCSEYTFMVFLVLVLVLVLVILLIRHVILLLIDLASLDRATLARGRCPGFPLTPFSFARFDFTSRGHDPFSRRSDRFGSIIWLMHHGTSKLGTFVR